MEQHEYHKELGLRLQKKYSREDLEYHFANCNIKDPIELGKVADSESGMWSRMLENAHWGIIGGAKLQEL